MWFLNWLDLPCVLLARGQQQCQGTAPVGPLRSNRHWFHHRWTSPGMTSFYLIHNFDIYAICGDAGAASPNGLKADVWARINRRGIHSRIYQYDISHHSNGNSNSATDEYHLHVNHSSHWPRLTGQQPDFALVLWCFSCRLQEPH